MKGIGAIRRLLAVSLAAVLMHPFVNGFHFRPDPPYILFYQGRKQTKVQFDEAALANVKQDERYVLKVMDRKKIKCCGRRKRISKYIWSCCDGLKARTTDPTLIKALELLWGI